MKIRYLGLVFLAGCADMGNPVAAIPEDAVRFNPPPEYQTYWTEAENFASLSGDFGKVVWMYEPDGHSIQTTEGGASGLGCWWNNTIVLTQINLNCAPLVRHEIIHLLICSASHPREYFDDKMGGSFIWPPKSYN